jgi:hypothetical protein
VLTSAWILWQELTTLDINLPTGGSVERTMGNTAMLTRAECDARRR